MWSDYYFGLKDFIKDVITLREDGDPETLEELIDFAETLDKRTWQRKMEKTQGHGFGVTKRYEGKNKYNHRTTRDPDAMDWEANAAVRSSANHQRNKGGPPRKGGTQKF